MKTLGVLCTGEAGDSAWDGLVAEGYAAGGTHNMQWSRQTGHLVRIG